MKFQFDPSLPHQQKAIASVVDVLEGLGTESSEISYITEGGSDGFAVGGVFANSFPIDGESLLRNIRNVQERNGLSASESLPESQLTVEMETGTGKTYVYLRTTRELHKRYGLTKFVVVVPSLAIREGVAKSIDMLADHFRSLYGPVACVASVFSSQRLSTIHRFSTTNALQILILNIDSFNRPSNIVNQPQAALNNLTPLSLLAACRPVVILDEPQNLEGESAQRAIASLSPSVILRYSATHRTIRNLVYRLGPVEAYEQRLVKRIEALPITAEKDYGDINVSVVGFKVTTRKVQYTLRMDCATSEGIREKDFSLVGVGHDLFSLTGEMPPYVGIRVVAVNAGDRSIELSNGITLTAGDDESPYAEERLRSQIQETIREHLEKELAVRSYFPEGQRLKVLSLFFVDRVAHYAASDGDVRRWFEETYQALSKLARYSSLRLPSVAQVHAGYFALTVAGKPKDTDGTTPADERAYELIMRGKEKLLSLDEPLRFIFSHSALREGWDNPNVFQICTLRRSFSAVRRRQEIGRGLRLPVNQNGQQVKDPAVNFLTVIANESYQSFAQALQSEYETECGVSFTGRIGNRRRRQALVPTEGWEMNKYFTQLWNQIARCTDLDCDFNEDAFFALATRFLSESPPIIEPRLIAQRASIEINAKGVVGALLKERELARQRTAKHLPNPLLFLQERTGLSRRVIAKVLTASGRVGDFRKNSDVFLRQAVAALDQALLKTLVDGARYTEMPGQVLSLNRMSGDHQETYEDRLVPVSKSVWSHVEFASEPERLFVESLEAREDIPFFVKLPRWFTVSTPAGDYVPDWGIVKQVDGDLVFFLVRETKSTWNRLLLTQLEQLKTTCGAKHFAAIGVDYAVVTDASQL